MSIVQPPEQGREATRFCELYNNVDQTNSNPKRYRLVVKESPATCKALPVSASGRNKRRRSSGSDNAHEQSPKQQKAHQRGCYHLEPNPVLMLEVDDHEGRSRHLQNPYLLCTVRLMQYNEEKKDWFLSDPKVFNGLQTHTLHTRTKKIATRSAENQPRSLAEISQGFFVFHNLTIAAEGRYRLKFTLQEVQHGTLGIHISSLTYVYSNEFEVVRSTAHVKKQMSSQLAQELKDCGFRLLTRTKTAPRKPKTESWDVNGAPHEIIRQFQTQNPGSFQVVQRPTGPRLVPPLLHSRQQDVPYPNLNQGLISGFQTSSNHLPFSTTMIPGTTPLGQLPGYAQFVGQRYPSSGDIAPPYSTSTVTQGYDITNGTAYSAPAVAAQTMQSYSIQTEMMHAGGYASNLEDGGSYLDLGNGSVATGYQQNVSLGSMHTDSALGTSDSRL